MNGKKIIAAMLFSLLAAAAGVCPAGGEEAKPTADLTVSVLSAYISKGDEMSRNSIVIQPQVTVAYKGISAIIWGNMDTNPYLSHNPGTARDKRQNWTETDLTIAYNRTFGIVNAVASYAYFGLSGAGPYSDTLEFRDDQEVTVGVGLNTILTPTLSISRSFDATQRWYFQLGVSHTFALTPAVSLKLAAWGTYLLSEDDNRPKISDDGIPYNGTMLPKERFSNFHDGVVTASLPIKIGQYMTVTPILSYNFPLCNDAKNDMKYRSMQYYGGWGPTTNFADVQSSFLVGGMLFSFSF